MGSSLVPRGEMAAAHSNDTGNQGKPKQAVSPANHAGLKHPREVSSQAVVVRLQEVVVRSQAVIFPMQSIPLANGATALRVQVLNLFSQDWPLFDLQNQGAEVSAGSPAFGFAQTPRSAERLCRLR